MLAVEGTYQNGHISLEKEFRSDKPVKIIVTFLVDVKEIEQLEKRLSLNDFSFLKSRKLLEHYKGSFSDEVIEERRSEL